MHRPNFTKKTDLLLNQLFHNFAAFAKLQKHNEFLPASSSDRIAEF
jgi:hypothetical protein